MLIQSAKGVFTPTDPLKTDVKSLLRFNSAPIVDETGIPIGSHLFGGVDVGIGKFGGSFYMWAESQILTGITLNNQCNWNHPEFTYEFWFKPKLGALESIRIVTQLTNNSTNWVGLVYRRIDGSNFNFGYYSRIAGVDDIAVPTVLSSIDWNFVSLQKGVQPNALTMHINGVLVTSVPYPHTLSGGLTYIGNAYSHTTTVRAPVCYVDEVRFTAKARYGSANYMPPTAPFPY